VTKPSIAGQGSWGAVTHEAKMLMARQGRHGATRRQAKGVSFDRWLDKVVTVAVLTAMIIGLAAVAAHWLL
tara:strand:- start:446 stop:658 length:213 start_codon:yes stop_codon:yes gene_type:complete